MDYMENNEHYQSDFQTIRERLTQVEYSYYYKYVKSA